VGEGLEGDGVSSGKKTGDFGGDFRGPMVAFNQEVVNVG